MDYHNTGNREYRDELMRIEKISPLPGSACSLITTEQKAALIDCGFSFCADKMIENIKSVLGSRPLDFILLTHSHYDHASGSGRCRLAYGGVQVVASEYAAKVFSRPSAISVIREMNESAAKYFGYEYDGGALGDLSVDLAVQEGDVIDLGNVTLQVMEAPGHTKCCISFYVPQNKMLIACETLGACSEEHLVAPGFLVSYGMSVNYMKRAIDMDIESLLVPHFGVLRGNSCREFLHRALKSAEALKDLIITDHLRGKTHSEIIEHYKEVFYNEELQKIQPLSAFYLNANHLVPMVITELLG